MIPILFWMADLERRRREETEDFIGHELGDTDLWVAWAFLIIMIGLFVAVVVTLP